MSTRPLNEFLNPTPNSQLKKLRQQESRHGKQAGAHLDDTNDIYDHTKSFFDGSAPEAQADIGDRQFKPNIADLMDEMDQKIYGAKKVSRKERDADVSDLSMSDKQSDEESEDMDEEGEQEMSDDSDQLVQDSVASSQSSEADYAKKEEESKIKNNKLIEELTTNKADKQVDKILNQLKEEAQDASVYAQKRHVSDLTKAKSVRNQKKVCDQMLQQRILLQKPMSNIAKYPNEQFYYGKVSEEITSKVYESKRHIKQHMKELNTIQKDMFFISETGIKLKEIDEDNTTDQIWQKLDYNIGSVLPFIESTIDQWNDRNQNIQTQKKKTNKNLNKTIIQQVNLILNDDDLRAQTLKKSQYKRDTYRVLGPSITNAPTDAEDDFSYLEQDHDENLFNDQDLYQNVLGDYLSMNDKNDDSGTQAVTGGGQDDGFLYGADLSMTQKYLMKRQKMKELNVQRRKEIDRKATKGRKIRYVVWDKMQNFMSAEPNLSLLEGKESIIKNLFGQQQGSEVKEKPTKEQKVLENGTVKLI